MEVKLSTFEAALLVQAVAGGGRFQQLSASRLSAAEKAGCKRLVKKGLMENIMDTFYMATDAGREHSARLPGAACPIPQ